MKQQISYSFDHICTWSIKLTYLLASECSPKGLGSCQRNATLSLVMDTSTSTALAPFSSADLVAAMVFSQKFIGSPPACPMTKKVWWGWKIGHWWSVLRECATDSLNQYLSEMRIDYYNFLFVNSKFKLCKTVVLESSSPSNKAEFILIHSSLVMGWT